MNLPSKLIEDAVTEISRLPGIGKKTALRLALHLLKQHDVRFQVVHDEDVGGLTHGVRRRGGCAHAESGAAEEGGDAGVAGAARRRAQTRDAMIHTSVQNAMKAISSSVVMTGYPGLMTARLCAVLPPVAVQTET